MLPLRFAPRIPRGAVLSCLLTITACGGGDGTPSTSPAPPALSLSAPPSASVSAGATSESEVRVVRTGGLAGAVGLRAINVPDGIVATITPAALAPTDTRATIRWTAAASAPPATHAITIVASASGVREASATIQLALTASAPLARSIQLLAGDAQRVPAGSPLPTAPRVRVNDQRGAPLGGVTVTFSVDSGAALLSDSVATTSSDGVATLGGWRPAPGRSVVRVAVAGVEPVRLHAVGDGELLVADSVLSGGGAIRVARPGDPLDGLTVSVPADAFRAPVRIGVRYGDTARPVSRVPRRFATPVIVLDIASSASADAPLTLRLPARTGANERPVAMQWDPATGAIDVLPTVRVDSQTVATLIRPSTASLVASGRRAATVLPASSTAGTLFAIRVVIGMVPWEELTRDIDIGYRPAVDDWESDLLRFYSPIERYDNALPLAAAWYFTHFKGTNGALHGRFRRAPGIPFSNPSAVRLGALLTQALNLTDGERYNQVLAELVVQEPGMTLDSLLLLQAKAGLVQTGRPQILLGRPLAPDGAGTLLLAYRASGSTLEVSLGTADPGPNAPKSLTLVNGEFPRFTWQPQDIDGPADAIAIDGLFSVGLTYGVPAATLNRLWQETIDGTIGRTELPHPIVVSREERDVGDILWVPEDTTRLWIECASCGPGYAPDPTISPQSSVHGAAIAYRAPGAPAWIDPKATVRGRGLKIDVARDEGRVYGLGIYRRGRTDDEGHYFAWREVEIRARRLNITPREQVTTPDTDIELVATLDQPMPDNPSWHWELGDGRTLVTSSGRLVTRYAPPPSATLQPYSVKVTLKRNGRTHATGRAEVTVDGRPLAWRLSIVAVQDEQCSVFSCAVFVNRFLRHLKTTPSHGVLRVFAGSGQPDLGPQYPTPGAYLDFPRVVVATQIEVRAAPDGWRVPTAGETGLILPLAHRFVGVPSGTPPYVSASGEMTITGRPTDGTLQGRNTDLGVRPTEGLRQETSISAIMRGDVIEGTIDYVTTSTITRTFNGVPFTPPFQLDRVRFTFVGRRVP